MRKMLSYAGFFAISGYALVSREGSPRAWIWGGMIVLAFVFMVFDIFVHRRRIAEVLRTAPRFSIGRFRLGEVPYGRGSHNRGRYGKFATARSGLDTFVLVASRAVYALAVAGALLALTAHFFSVGDVNEDVLGVFFAVLGLCTLLLTMVRRRKRYVRWVRSRVMKR